MGTEGYLIDKVTDSKIKEQWARLRCGSIGRERSKEFIDGRCRLCRRVEETLEHVWNCRIAREGMNGEWMKEIEERVDGRRGKLLGQTGETNERGAL